MECCSEVYFCVIFTTTHNLFCASTVAEQNPQPVVNVSTKRPVFVRASLYHNIDPRWRLPTFTQCSSLQVYLSVWRAVVAVGFYGFRGGVKTSRHSGDQEGTARPFFIARAPLASVSLAPIFFVFSAPRHETRTLVTAWKHLVLLTALFIFQKMCTHLYFIYFFYNWFFLIQPACNWICTFTFSLSLQL